MKEGNTKEETNEIKERMDLWGSLCQSILVFFLICNRKCLTLFYVWIRIYGWRQSGRRSGLYIWNHNCITAIIYNFTALLFNRFV